VKWQIDHATVRQWGGSSFTSQKRHNLQPTNQERKTNMNKQRRFVVFACTLLLFGTTAAFCQGERALGSVGFGVKVSTLGVGAEVATPIVRRVTVRAGFNVLGYSTGFNSDGIAYDGHLNFKTVEGHVDYFPFGGKFHVSPGFLAYINDPIKATALVPGGQS
jgi:hypothetical protein